MHDNDNALIDIRSLKQECGNIVAAKYQLHISLMLLDDENIAYWFDYEINLPYKHRKNTAVQSLIVEEFIYKKLGFKEGWKSQISFEVKKL